MIFSVFIWIIDSFIDCFTIQNVSVFQLLYQACGCLNLFSNWCSQFSIAHTHIIRTADECHTLMKRTVHQLNTLIQTLCYYCNKDIQHVDIINSINSSNLYYVQWFLFNQQHHVSFSSKSTYNKYSFHYFTKTYLLLIMSYFLENRDFFRRSSVAGEYNLSFTFGNQNRRRHSQPKICTFDCPNCRKLMLTAVSERNLSSDNEQTPRSEQDVTSSTLGSSDSSQSSKYIWIES